MNRKLLIKVCGMKDPGNVEELCRLRPDLLGYIFYPPSPRFVGTKPDPAIFHVSGDILRVGVFVNESTDRILNLYGEGFIDMVQLHGHETPGTCLELKKAGMKVIKAIAANRVEEAGILEQYAHCADYLLMDTPTETHGGSGKKFNWSLLEENIIPLPFILSGGLGPGDAAAIAEIGNEGLAGLDLNSRFEKAPGMKDVKLLGRFIQEIRNI